ncbi:MAG: hypothetical protein GF398_07930 [Chitinivibrionales bacterium]|nr:hypothetical protein [Chitinivibrionales bacterium]
MRRKRLFVYLACMAIVFPIIVVTQTRLTKMKDDSWLEKSMSYLPQSKDLKPYLMGFHTVYASYLWIKTTLYFGEHNQGDKQFPWLISMVDMVTKLHPHFQPAYEFAGLMLPEHCNNIKAAHIILERGISHIREKPWKLPFYAGWMYHEKVHDKEMAARYLSRAGRHKGAPALYSLLAASLYRDVGLKNQGLAFLQSIYESVESPQSKKMIKKKIVSLIENEPDNP